MRTAAILSALRPMQVTIMYYPLQIPYQLNRAFAQNITYTETSAVECGGFVLCFWAMQPVTSRNLTVRNIIVTDGCIDLIANFEERQVGFAGMSRTDFHFDITLPAHFIGARLTPGAFYQLTGLDATEAMDTFLPIENVFRDFDEAYFFSLSFDEANMYFKRFLLEKTRTKTPDLFMTLFHTLSDQECFTTKELYRLLHFSPRQCQRLFIKHFGIGPKMALSVVRFQKCLEILTSPETTTADLVNVAGYYDQPHLIKDFKRNIGITPLELIRIYQT